MAARPGWGCGSGGPSGRGGDGQWSLGQGTESPGGDTESSSTGGREGCEHAIQLPG